MLNSQLKVGYQLVGQVREKLMLSRKDSVFNPNVYTLVIAEKKLKPVASP